MMTTPTKFQVHMTLYTNMTPEVPVKKSSLNDDYTHEVSSPYDPYTNMFPPPTSDDPDSSGCGDAHTHQVPSSWNVRLQSSLQPILYHNLFT